LAYPGTLPVVNHEAVRHVLRVGAAVDGTLASFTEFDRKSYFYPDIPKGYQISQYQYPLVLGGELCGVRLTRVHLEEDTARSTHDTGTSLVDFNRAGVPLMELVTEPVIHDAETAGRFARELQLLLRTLGASEAHLEKGEMRIEANISVSASDTFGTKVEVKNLNSFRSVERAIAFEIERHIAVLESGGTIVQETRGWDEARQNTFHQRFKEGSADYRYFPEPDIPKFSLDEYAAFSKEAILATLPELPWIRRERYKTDLQLKESDNAYISATPERSHFFDAVVERLTDRSHIQLAANYLVTDIAGLFAKQGTEDYTHLDPAAFAKLMHLLANNNLSSRGAKDILAIMIGSGGDPETLAQENGLLQVTDIESIRTLVRGVITAEAKAVEEYKAGKEASLQYLIGKGMQASRGAGNPALIAQVLREELGNE
jgi:aspartyl-tRNA(Asn)/glutamyl-tRNA(Gln) amidotransferase subunit B